MSVYISEAAGYQREESTKRQDRKGDGREIERKVAKERWGGKLEDRSQIINCKKR